MKTVTVKYRAGHSYDFTYEKIDQFFCPSCGSKEHMWVETSGGDYYEGSQYVCTNCNNRHHLDHSGLPASEDEDFQVIKQLKG